MEVQGCDGDDLERHKIKDEKTFTATLETNRFNQDESPLDFSDFDSAVGFNDLDSIIDCSDLDIINEFNDSFVDSNADSALGCDEFEDEFEDENVNNQIKYEQENDKIIFDHDSFIRENPDEYDKTVNQSNYSTIKLCNKPLCNFQTNIKRDFYNHCLTHEKKDQLPFECHFCFERFKSISVCNDHIRRKHGVPISRKYQCEICGKLVANHNKSHICNNVNSADETHQPKSAKSLKKKRKSTSKQTNLFHSCDYCNFTSKRSYDVKRHQSVHNDKTDVFLCSENDCSYQCSDKFSFKAHKNTHKDVGFNLDKAFECQICFMNFKKKKSLAEHTKKRHPSACTTCKNCNSLYTNVATHRCSEKKKSAINEICDICGEETPNIRKHNHNVHKISQFICDICPKQFSSKSNLEKHKINHAKLKRKFVCDICTQSFNKSSHLKSHSLIHKEDAELNMKSCNMCPYKTFIDSNLTRHIKSHANKTVKCALCGKCMKNEVSLRDVNLLYIRRYKTYVMVVPNGGGLSCENAFAH